MKQHRPVEQLGTGAGPKRPRRRLDRGISLVELLLATGTGAIVIFAMVTVYLVGFDSWTGSARRAAVQQEASTTMEIIARKVRPASRVVISGSPDSLALQLNTAGGPVPIGSLHLVNGNLRDENGVTLSSGISTLAFSTADSRSLVVDLEVTDQAGTPNRTSDDAVVRLSTTILCRN
jgi:Tfp pilus assembly protein PilW